MSQYLIMIIYIGIFIAMIYFMTIRPQQKEKKAKEAMLASVTIGDYVMTTCGFYGKILAITDDTVIIEFGDNKNCRIPMQKEAIARIEKAEEAK